MRAEDSFAVPPAGSTLVPPSSLPMVSGWALCESAARKSVLLLTSVLLCRPARMLLCWLQVHH